MPCCASMDTITKKFSVKNVQIDSKNVLGLHDHLRYLNVERPLCLRPVTRFVHRLGYPERRTTYISNQLHPPKINNDNTGHFFLHFFFFFVIVFAFSFSFLLRRNDNYFPPIKITLKK